MFSLALWASLSLSVKVRAQEVVQDSFDCGEQVVVQASPMPGYRFVRWSDGDTCALRTIDLKQDTAIEAVFAPECVDREAQVDRIYDWLMVVNKNKLLSEGWLNSEAEEEHVKWYHVVDSIDDIGLHDVADSTCDELVMTGFSLALSPEANWQEYYAEVSIDEAKAAAAFLCHPVLRGFPGVHSALDNNPSGAQSTIHYPHKFFKDGTIYIKRNESIYTIDGQKIDTIHQTPDTKH